MTIARRLALAGLAASVIGLAGCSTHGATPQGDYGTIFGTVTGPSGAPLAGATITVDTVLTATTGPDGKYRVTTVPVDSSTTHTTVTATAPGYFAPAQYPQVTANAEVEVDFKFMRS